MSDPLSLAALPPIVLLDLDWQQPGRRELAERIIAALAVLGKDVSTTRDGQLPADRPIDLVISERPTALAELALRLAPAGGSIGLIVLGQPDAQADAQLPLDFSDRELLLACRLVGEIVALRRRSHDVERNSHELARLAAADPLTGLANRRAWDAEAPDRLGRALSAGQAVCLAIFDVDRFKEVNYVHGYSVGDAVLAAIGTSWAASCGRSICWPGLVETNSPPCWSAPSTRPAPWRLSTGCDRQRASGWRPSSGSSYR